MSASWSAPSACWVALTLALSVACSAEPEVVARSRTNAALPEPEGGGKCREGRYKGLFYTDPGSPLVLSGPMEFSLVPSLRGEFLEIGPSTRLVGTDQSGQSMFTANVLTEACVEGKYTTELTDGHFTLLDSAGRPIPGWDFPFTGTIEGEYIDSGRVFFGTWTSGSAVLTLTGSWVASWYSEADAGD